MRHLWDNVINPILVNVLIPWKKLLEHQVEPLSVNGSPVISSGDCGCQFNPAFFYAYGLGVSEK
jgi:hypothetical protein